jgi:aerobic carbon-monoxide dehydrogenase large subunit
MNLQEQHWAVQNYGIGQPVARTEDPRLVRGEGRYTDDIDVPGQAYLAMVRSRHAHGRISRIDLTPARKMPGVLGAYTGADLAAAGYGSLDCGLALKNRDGTAMRKPRRPALPTDRVRFVGDPVAFVVAESPAQARDAAEAVMLEIEVLPAVVNPSEAAAPDAPQLYLEAPGNIALDYHYGDTEKVAAAFARAAHVTRLRLVNNRVVVNALEPRAAIGVYEAETFTLHVGCQGVFGLRGQIAHDILKVPPTTVRVLTGNVGGSFGMKAAVYPEYVCVLHGARALGRPVKWTADRFESFVADHHGRDSEFVGELALDADGQFLALRLSGVANMGAYLGSVAPLMQTLNIVKNSASVYRTPLIEVSTKCVFTNTTLVSAYRGAGRPEGNYFTERLIDAAATETGIDRILLRQRNHIRPLDMPYAAASGMTYDSGDFSAVLERAVEIADVKGFNARRQESLDRGKLRGLGIGSYLEVTAPPNKEMGGVRFEPDGTVTIITGTLDYGQGHATPFAQIMSEKLGIPFDRIQLLQGDSDALVAGGGTGGSRSIMSSGTAIVEATTKVIAKGKIIASHVLEAAPADIEFDGGRFLIAGTDRAIGLLELAAQIRGGSTLPKDVPHSLDVSHVTEPIPSAFPNGCHVAEIEIDPQTGVVEVTRYSSVNDFGTIINPLLVEGQVHGGILQGIGQALMEHGRYDADGQLVSGSFMDYALPRATDAPLFRVESYPVPAKTNPLGTKGCGEAGCAGALTSVMNAVVDALSGYGISNIEMPATPARVWGAIADAQKNRATPRSVAGPNQITAPGRD